MLSTRTSSAAAIPEHVTHAAVQFLPLPGPSGLALIALDNGESPDRPNSLVLQGFAELEDAVDQLRLHTMARQISAIGFTGKTGSFGAGAALKTYSVISEPATARLSLAGRMEVRNKVSLRSPK